MPAVGRPTGFNCADYSTRIDDLPFLEHFRKSCNTVTAGFEAVRAVDGEDVLDGVGDGVPELLLSSGDSGSQVRLQLGKDVLDWIQIR